MRWSRCETSTMDGTSKIVSLRFPLVSMARRQCVSSGPSSANHVARRHTLPALATPSDHMVTCTSHFVAVVCHRGVASAHIMINSRSCLVILNVPHAQLNANWLCITSTSGHTAADRRETTPDDTSKTVATRKIVSPREQIPSRTLSFQQHVACGKAHVVGLSGPPKGGPWPEFHPHPGLGHGFGQGVGLQVWPRVALGHPPLWGRPQGQLWARAEGPA